MILQPELLRATAVQKLLILCMSSDQDLVQFPLLKKCKSWYQIHGKTKQNNKKNMELDLQDFIIHEKKKEAPSNQLILN